MLNHFHFCSSPINKTRLSLTYRFHKSFFMRYSSIAEILVMKQLVLLRLSFLLCQISLVMTNAVPDKKYSMTDLLEPQKHLQINLRIPDYYYATVSKLSPALTASINFLMSQNTPFRLFYNFTASNQKPPLVFFPTRHVRNEVIWLVFVIIQEETEALDL